MADRPRPSARVADDERGARRRALAQARGLTPAPGSEGRSRNQRAIRRTDTKPELRLRSLLHRRGLRFRKDLRLDLPDGSRVRPDVVFTRAKVAVFYDSCFWHSCPEHGRQPRVNDWYWAPKLARTAERDQQATAALERYGWHVIRIWEHDDLLTAVDQILAAIDAKATGRLRRAWDGFHTLEGCQGRSCAAQDGDDIVRYHRREVTT